jgi:hypothetical protein
MRAPQIDAPAALGLPHGNPARAQGVDEDSSSETRRSSDLTPSEQENARVAIRFLATRYGDFAKLAKAMGAQRETVQRPAKRGARVTAGIALRAARVAGVALEDVLAGRWPVAGVCLPQIIRRATPKQRQKPPMCGRILL